MGTDEITLGHLLETYYRESNDERDRGDKFERLVRSYLTTDPERASQFSDVWLWKDYPGRGSRNDAGIDLVARERYSGALTAIQAKFYDPDRTIAKGDIDKFISGSPSPEFSNRLLVHTGRIGPTAERTLKAQDPPVLLLDPHQMDRSDIQWSDFQVAHPERMVHKSETKTAFLYQREAMTEVAEGFQSSDRGKLIMACGTGKTFTSLQIVQDQTPADATILFLVPSIALLDQTLREWKRDAATDFRALAVCSDVSVGKNKNEEDISTTDLLVPATTDASRLVEQWRQATDYHGRTVVFSTYQSIDVIHQAQQQGFDQFDLIICDEAHRTTGATVAGQDESAFTKIHSDSIVDGAKRLYMTATPRVFDEGSKKKADENSVVVASMDDETLYGPEFHRLGFGEAVSRGLLTDYRVLVLAVDETSVNRNFQRLLTDEEGELKIDDVAKIVGCWNGLSHRGQHTDDAPVPAMQRAVAFASNIKESQRVASMFEKITDELATSEDDGGLVCRAEHVDGTMNVTERARKLNWLEATPEEDEARILTNARCLSEGVDVPSLDAVMFLNPRNSQVDVVQSVGRVMRKAQDKDYGYIILPVGIQAGQSPEQALKDSKKYKVIWSVLNALRSHDDRFEATVNKIDLNENRGENIDVIGVGVTEDDDDTATATGQQLTIDLEFPGLEEWKDAIYAKIVQKVGDRRYWEDWAADIADVATRHTERITTLVTQDPAPDVAEEFDAFVQALKHNLNQGITEADAISMLSQHLITKPVFDALFEGYDFAANNPVSVVMQNMVNTLEGQNLQAETASLEGFYKSVAERAAGIDNAEGKQQIITELYEKFFKRAFPAQADALGVVYTPVEIVDFIIHAVDDLSKQHFGAGLTDEGVHVLDPFTGTGTFIVRLLQSGVITPHDLARKYAGELHATEIMLLAYYIAAINIEATYHGLLKDQSQEESPQHNDADAPYVPFNGIVLGDTFQMTEDGDTIDSQLFTSNSERAQRQLDTDIRVIIGNPPYSAGQGSENDNNRNEVYPSLDERIRQTYAESSRARSNRTLYDSYIRAIRWGTDRIGDQGILAYVSNGGYIDDKSADGLRKTFIEDFDHLYIYNLRGNQRTAGELSRKEGGKVFGAGSRATVAIMVGVKDPTHTGETVLHYRDIGDYLTRADKLATIRESTINSTRWETITPNTKGEWINQSSDIFDTFPPLGDKKGETGRAPVFATYSGGLGTGRDAWLYNFSRASLEKNVSAMTDSYNEARIAYHSEKRATHNEQDTSKWLNGRSEFLAPSRISWTRSLRQNIARNTHLTVRGDSYRTGAYRPFALQHVYFQAHYNHERSQLPHVFPTVHHANFGFHTIGVSTPSPFAVLATDAIPNYHVLGAGTGGQFFPRYTWEPVEDADDDLLSGLDDPDDRVVVDGYRRVDNITDSTLSRYQEAFGEEIIKDAIFVHIYALLHSQQYRTTFAAELKRQLPRIPLPGSSTDFWAFAEAGQRLLDLHLNYETAEPYPLVEETMGGDASDPALYRVQKMKWGGKARSADKTRLVYNQHITLTGIPDEAHEYMLGSRSALEWLIDRYQVKTDKNSGIVNDPNDWAAEHNDPRYILDLVKKITTVSVETVRITRSLPDLSLNETA